MFNVAHSLPPCIHRAHIPYLCHLCQLHTFTLKKNFGEKSGPVKWRYQASGGGDDGVGEDVDDGKPNGME